LQGHLTKTNHNKQTKHRTTPKDQTYNKNTNTQRKKMRKYLGGAKFVDASQVATSRC